MSSTLQDIRNKVRRVTARPNQNQISDGQIDDYINTFYLYDMPEQLKMESFRTTWQFVTQPNIMVYNMPVDTYLQSMVPVYVAGYQCSMTQNRESFFRFSPNLNFMQQAISLGNGDTGGTTPYTGTLSSAPIMSGYGQNFDASSPGQPPNMSNFNWKVMFSAPNGNGGMSILVDSGPSVTDKTIGCLLDPSDAYTNNPALARGTIDYLTGAYTLGNVALVTGFASPVPVGASINVQYTPYVAARPQNVCVYQDQVMLFPIPDQAYPVSFEVFQRPTAFIASSAGGDPDAAKNPQLKELWQLLAYGAADKIFADNADIDNMMKFRPLLEEQMKLCLRRTIGQYSSERAATIYTEQTGLTQYPFSNVYSGF
jgi:hypothetical protein